MFISYEVMYGEYENAIDIQKNIINKRKEDLKKAREKGNFKEVKRLNSLIVLLYQEKSELEERAKGLREYIS